MNCIGCSNILPPEAMKTIGQCSKHFLCINCYENFYKYQEAIDKCKFCTLFFFPSKSRLKLFSCCSYCITGSNLSGTCTAHTPCEDCILSNFCRNDKINVKNCFYCYKTLESTCRKCLRPVCDSDQVKTPGCTNHFYCNSCIDGFLKHGPLPKCKLCQEYYASSFWKICILCKISKASATTQSCLTHHMCLSCLNNLVYTFNHQILQSVTCEQCKIFIESHISSNNHIFTHQSVSFSQFNADSLHSNIYPEAYYQTEGNYHMSLNPTTFRELGRQQSLHAEVPYNTEGYYHKSLNPTNFRELECQQSLHAEVPYNTEGYYHKSLNPTNFRELECQQSLHAEVPYNTEINRNVDYISKTPMAFCCGKSCPIMECGHPLCLDCIARGFLIKFEEFLLWVFNNDLENLNKRVYAIGCHVTGCYNTLCIPFSIVSGYTNDMLLAYNLDFRFIERYGVLFEGIPMKFEICSKCSRTSGEAVNNYCFWCNT